MISSHEQHTGSYLRFLEEFKLSERVHNALNIKPNPLSEHLVTQLTTGQCRKFDSNTINNLKLYLPPEGTCLAIGDGCSIPFNPPNYGAPWLSSFLTHLLPHNQIISSDLVDDKARFIFVTKCEELILFGGRFFDFENSRFYNQNNGQAQEQYLQDDNHFLRHLAVISDSDRWRSRSTEILAITAERPAALTLLLQSLELRYSEESLKDFEIKIISGKDRAWEKKVFGIDSQHSVDVFNLGSFKEIQNFSYLLARHLTPEVVEQVLQNLDAVTSAVAPKCFIDISTEGLHSKQRGESAFGVRGYSNNLEIFNYTT